MDNATYNAYAGYMLQNGLCEREHEINSARLDLLEDMINSLDYHCDTRRNGELQPLLLTRGGEQYTYNVICRPGDELFAGDTIDAFGHKWIVMEARADSTTHKTGVMHQCNKLFRFQNFTPDIIERWGFVDISGYSSSFNSDTQMQHSSEQVAIYLPYDEETAKIYVDKRIPSHVGYDSFGQKMLFSFKITGVNPVSESYNHGDHLLMLKAERYLFAQDKDNLDLEICDYIDPKDSIVIEQGAVRCEIIGGKTIRTGSARKYQAVFYDKDGTAMDGIAPLWTLEGDGASLSVLDGVAKVVVEDRNDLIGSDITLTLTADGRDCDPSSVCVEVIGFV